MRRTGERLSHGRLAVAALLVLLTVPFLMWAVAPAAVSAVVPSPAIPVPAGADGVPAPVADAVAMQGDADAARERIGGTESIIARPDAARGRAARQVASSTDLPPGAGERAVGVPSLRPGDAGWVARRLEIPALGVNVAVALAGGPSTEDFPPFDGAYILRSSAQPGRGTNSYLFAHAMPALFKPLWWAQAGQQVIVTMSDGQQLPYRVTGVVRDIPCPDASAPKPAGLPPALAYATECDMSWTLPTASERLTLQTSQGFNRNYGEMVVIAEPDWGP